jgi:hypothetical protein
MSWCHYIEPKKHSAKEKDGGIVTQKMVSRGGICKYLIIIVERWIGTLINK